VGCFSLHQTESDPSSFPQHPNTVRVIGAGPAGCAASIAAAAQGSPVELFEKSSLPRHKVCGEFLSPGIAPLLDRLGVWGAVQDAGAVPIHRMLLRFPRSEKCATLPETAYGLSRFTLDAILLKRALQLGVHLHHAAGAAGRGPVVVAAGRSARTEPSTRGRRLFGFKAHFEGPQDDSVALYFGRGVYVGVSSVEGGRTNVCGLGNESVLARNAFHYDSLCDSVPGLRERLSPLTRCMEWLTVGPVIYRNNLRSQSEPGVYLAGDALAFVDPFTGSGITSAVFSGTLAGLAAASGNSNSSYVANCRDAMGNSLRISLIVRNVLESGLAGGLAAIIPAGALFRLTRPAFGRSGNMQ
jgi:hypothetical protein